LNYLEDEVSAVSIHFLRYMIKPENRNPCPINIERYDSKRINFIEGKSKTREKIESSRSERS